MSQELVQYLTSHALTTALMVSAPLLLAGMIIGILISLFQAVTQINEMTLSFVPKIIVTALVLLLAAPWMSAQVVDFTRYVIQLIPTVAR